MIMTCEEIEKRMDELARQLYELVRELEKIKKLEKQ
jgi:hypothetical protein